MTIGARASWLLQAFDVGVATIIGASAALLFSFRTAELVVTMCGVAVAAYALSFPYRRFVQRSATRIIVRAVVGGIAYAIAITALFGVLFGAATWLQSLDASHGHPMTPFEVLGLIVFWMLPFSVSGGLLFGAIHGALTRRMRAQPGG